MNYLTPQYFKSRPIGKYHRFYRRFRKPISMKERKYYKRPFRCKIHNFSWVRSATSSCRHFIHKNIIMQGRHISAAIFTTKTSSINHSQPRSAILIIELHCHWLKFEKLQSDKRKLYFVNKIVLMYCKKKLI